jgi:aminoglycoside phosphotransferase (APT) family kinase protein
MTNQQDVSGEPDWGRIFRGPIEEIEHASQGYANDTWIIGTEKRSYVVKATRTFPSPTRPFWDGMLTLFGMSIYHHIKHRRALAGFLRRHSPLTIPHALHIDMSEKIFPRPFIVYEKLPGEPANLDGAADSAGAAAFARQLGDHLGRLHTADFQFWGSYPSPPDFALKDWPLRLSGSLKALAHRWFSDQPEVLAALPGFVSQARRLPPPASAALVLPDLRPNQFLVSDGHLSALVDIESHVLGPRELDFIALEYMLTPQTLPAFMDGYTRHLPLPNMASVRPLYRYLYWLITALGMHSYAQWMNQPALFE